ncbi:aldehyde dehydrogenase family protein [Sulfobacillus harzensis]|uniref:Aldehyde dehydrogenase family protein n=1 Tax=Sulfobacillus harzensis TaxID=2729629 RepID=A0A7Y0L1R9_9FIRM|nr:aldehyde dehydrogenase family protein [Sulfobacillus harzensis]NMP21427.1 aldehyde dehydrogenase family protein [Sulfobacillus harzensis]
MLEGASYIDGTWAASGERQEIHNPAEWDEVVGVVGLAGSGEVNAAVSAARRAFGSWHQLGPVARGNLLFQAASRIESSVDELAQLASREMGKPIGETRGEALRAVAILRYYAGEGMRGLGDVIPASNARTLQYTTRVPLGPVAIITPWNFPLAIPMWKMAPALIYGNTVVVKPAEWSSLTAVRMWQLMADLFPPGVANLVLGLGSTVGEALIQHPDIRGISFTGSVAVGSHIADVATRRGVKYQTEMGGKNAVVVSEDADLDRAVNAIISGAMRSAGQKCTATSRVIVFEAAHDALMSRMREQLATIKVGNPLDPDTYLGPVVSEAQYQKVLKYIEIGEQEGRLVAGGSLQPANWGRGFYIQPTLFDQVEPESRIAQEEIFGPVVAAMTVRSLDEAISVVNGIPYGLSASIFTRNLKTALDFVERAEVGLVRVNDETAGVELQAPFGGMKGSSSHSREQGRAAIEFYTDVKTVAICP